MSDSQVGSDASGAATNSSWAKHCSHLVSHLALEQQGNHFLHKLSLTFRIKLPKKIKKLFLMGLSRTIFPSILNNSQLTDKFYSWKTLLIWYSICGSMYCKRLLCQPRHSHGPSTNILYSKNGGGGVHSTVGLHGNYYVKSTSLSFSRSYEGF